MKHATQSSPRLGQTHRRCTRLRTSTGQFSAETGRNNAAASTTKRPAVCEDEGAIFDVDFPFPVYCVKYGYLLPTWYTECDLPLLSYHTLKPSVVFCGRTAKDVGQNFLVKWQRLSAF